MGSAELKLPAGLWPILIDHAAVTRLIRRQWRQGQTPPIAPSHSETPIARVNQIRVALEYRLLGMDVHGVVSLSATGAAGGAVHSRFRFEMTAGRGGRRQPAAGRTSTADRRAFIEGPGTGGTGFALQGLDLKTVANGVRLRAGLDRIPERDTESIRSRPGLHGLQQGSQCHGLFQSVLERGTPWLLVKPSDGLAARRDRSR